MQFLKKFGAEIIRLVLFAAVLGAVGASGQVYKWSQTPGTNSTVDPHINWSVGMAPSAVGASSRAEMAELAKYRDDISGAITTGGTASAYTVTTNQGFSSSIPNGTMLSFSVNNTSAAGATLTVDGIGPYPIRTSTGVSIGAGTLVLGSPYTATFYSSTLEWVLRDLSGNPYAVPLGGFLHSTIATPPNSNFITPIGQCISTTTYNTYWVALGSPASGGCGGGQFAVVDVRGRNLTALDTLSSSAANRLTSASTGCGTSFTTMGATCANAGQSITVGTTNLPPYTPTGANTITAGGAGATAVATGASGTAVTGGGGISVYTVANGFALGVAWAGNAQGGTSTPIPSVSPNLGVYVFLRVL